jgi:hypothetical protein
VQRGVLVVLAIACKADDKPPPASRRPEPAAELPAPSSAPGRVPIAQLIPTIDGAKLLQTHERTDTQTFVRWCIDEPDAAKRVMDTLTREGWRDVESRGTGDRLGVAGTKGDARFSASVGGRDEACAGSLVTATIMRLGAIRIPAVEDRVR